MRVMVLGCFVAGVAAFGLCAAQPLVRSVDAERPWYPTESGCFEASLHDGLRQWRDAPGPMPDLRFSIQPDGRGPIHVVQVTGYPADDPADATVVLAVGNLSHTCVRRLALAECPGAAEARELLLSTGLPVHHGEPGPRFWLHPVIHAIEVRYAPAFGWNRWAAHEAGHPLVDAVQQAVALVEECWQPAADDLEAINAAMNREFCGRDDLDESGESFCRAKGLR